MYKRKKWRIVSETFGDGHIKYFAEYRVFPFIWSRPFKIFDGLNSKYNGQYSKTDCRKFIEDFEYYERHLENYRQSEKVVKRNVEDYL